MKIALGTVQFGASYGISNLIGKTKELEVRKIIEYAHKHDISMLDTASSYGNSEEVIGNYIHSHSDEEWDIITKTPCFIGSVINNKQLNKLRNDFILSQQKLTKYVSYGLLIHCCDNLFLPGGEQLLQEMEKLKKEGLIKKIGVSIYNSEQIDRVLDRMP